MSLCNFCRKAVIGLEGQYSFIDSMWLDRNSPQWESLCGACHISCLQQSNLLESWVSAIIGFYIGSRQWTRAASLDDGFILLAKVPKQHVLAEWNVIAKDGRMWNFNSRVQRLTLVGTDGGVLRMHNKCILLHHIAPSEALSGLDERLRHEGERPLAELIDALELREAIVDMRGIDVGIIRLNSPGDRLVLDSSLACTVEYGEFIPQSVYDRGSNLVLGQCPGQ